MNPLTQFMAMTPLELYQKVIQPAPADAYRAYLMEVSQYIKTECGFTVYGLITPVDPELHRWAPVLTLTVDIRGIWGEADLSATTAVDPPSPIAHLASVTGHPPDGALLRLVLPNRPDVAQAVLDGLAAIFPKRDLANSFPALAQAASDDPAIASGEFPDYLPAGSIPYLDQTTAPIEVAWQLRALRRTRFGTGHNWSIPNRLHDPIWRLSQRDYLGGSTLRLPDSIIDRLPAEVIDQEMPRFSDTLGQEHYIAYYRTLQDAARHRLTEARPGRYFKRVLKDLASDDEIKQLAAELTQRKQVTVSLAPHDPDEYARIYQEGPSSCMSAGQEKFTHTIDTYGDWRHPTEVYAHPDNAIRLVVAEVDGRVAARALVNTEDRTYPSLYGSDWAPHARQALRRWLENQGYTQNDYALYGQHLLLIELQNGGYLCPYIDSGGLYVDLMSDSLYISDDGDYDAPHDWGYMHEQNIAPGENDGEPCDHCDERVDEDDLTETYCGDRVCGSCLDHCYVQALNEDGYLEYYPEDHDDITDLGRYVTHHRTRQTASWVHLDIDLDCIGCIMYDGEIVHLNDCYPTPDGEHIPESHVWDLGHSTNATASFDYILVDGVAHPSEDCVFHHRLAAWVLLADHPVLDIA